MSTPPMLHLLARRPCSFVLLFVLQLLSCSLPLSKRAQCLRAAQGTSRKKRNLLGMLPGMRKMAADKARAPYGSVS
jgi:hypothetical protein